MSKLLPCPFCGSRPTLLSVETRENDAIVECQVCAVYQSGLTDDEATGRWNARAPLPSGAAWNITATPKSVVPESVTSEPDILRGIADTAARALPSGDGWTRIKDGEPGADDVVFVVVQFGRDGRQEIHAGIWRNLATWRHHQPWRVTHWQHAHLPALPQENDE